MDKQKEEMARRMAAKLMALHSGRGGAINETAKMKGQVCIVLKGPDGEVKEQKIIDNVICTLGSNFYAERAVKTAIPTNFTDGSGDFDGVFELWKSVTAAPAVGNDYSDLDGSLITGSSKAMTATYPKLNDADTDNPGRGANVITYAVSYLTSEANDTFDDVVITNPTPTGSEPLLMHADGLATTKTSNDTMKVFVNHTLQDDGA